MRKYLLLLLLLASAACTHIDRQVEGWPQDLVIQEEQVSFAEVYEACWDDMPFLWKLSLPLIFACTVVDLDAGTCKILRWQDSLSDDLDAHEKGHCKGGAHDDGLQEYFDKWNATRKEKESK